MSAEADDALEPELRTPVPRPARMAARQRWLLTSVGLVPALGAAALAAFFLASGFLKANLYADLKARGQTTVGRVTDVTGRQSFGRALRYVAKYQFQAGGTTYSGVSEGVAPGTRVGDPVTVTYLPSSPNTHRFSSADGKSLQGDRDESRELAEVVVYIFAFLSVVFGLFVFLPGYLEVRRELGLLRDGTPTAGTVTAVTPYGLSYKVAIPGLGEREAKATLTTVGGTKLAVGSRLTVLYDPRRPRRFAAYQAIRHVRRGGAA